MAKQLGFSKDEMALIEQARVLVSAGDFKLTQADFIKIATLHQVDEVLGVSREVALRRIRERKPFPN